jgi:hypothetical protein
MTCQKRKHRERDQACILTTDTRCSQSSHHSSLPPRNRDAKRSTMTTTGMRPLTYAVTRMVFVRLSCGLLHSVACARSIPARPRRQRHRLMTERQTHQHTKRLLVRAPFFQARLQDLGRVWRRALALDVEEAAPDGGKVLSDTLQLCGRQHLLPPLANEGRGGPTPHGGIEANASAAGSLAGPAVTATPKTPTNSTKATMRRKNRTPMLMKEHSEGSVRATRAAYYHVVDVAGHTE